MSLRWVTEKGASPVAATMPGFSEDDEGEAQENRLDDLMDEVEGAEVEGGEVDGAEVEGGGVEGGGVEGGEGGEVEDVEVEGDDSGEDSGEEEDIGGEDDDDEDDNSEYYQDIDDAGVRGGYNSGNGDSPSSSRNGDSPGAMRNRRDRDARGGLNEDNENNEDDEGFSGGNGGNAHIQRHLATHKFAGWDSILPKLVPPNGRDTLAPDLFGVSGASQGFWRDVRMTSLCGSGKHDLLFIDPYEMGADFDWAATFSEAERSGLTVKDWLKSKGKPYSKGNEPMPPGVRQERNALWFDRRARNVETDDFLEGQSELCRETSAVTRPGLPRGSMVMNIASCLRRHGGRGLLDLAFSQAHGCDPALAKRALATATMISAMCQPMEMGWQSGDHAELVAWRDEQRVIDDAEDARAAAQDARAGEDGASVSGGGSRKRQKKEAREPEIRKYTYFCKGRSEAANSIDNQKTDGERPKFVYVLERLVDEESEHLTHGHRLHIVVYDPKFSNTYLLSKLMETARKVT